jgi:aminobenzoyl-glutamate utilization protein B
MTGHHWSAGMAMATPIAHQGATAGAKAHALTLLDLMLDPKLIEAARSYFAGQTKDVKWKSLIPEGTEPPIQINREKMDRFRPALRALRYDPKRHRTYLEQLGVTYPATEPPAR